MRWEVKPLGELCSIQNGFAFKSKLFGDDGMPLIRIRDLSNGFETQTRYSGEYDENFVVNAGDVLVGMDGEFRCYEWKGEPALLNQRVCRLEGFDRRLSPRYTYYGINKYLKAIEEVTSFTTVKHLSAKKIKGIQFPIPPFEEQERIVEVLDEAFAAIDKAKANIERNLTNARELFQSRLNDIFSNPSEDWEVKLLGEVCENLDSKRVPITKSKRVSGETPYYGASGVVDWVEGYIFDEDLLLISEDGANLLARTYPIAFSISGKTWVNNHAHVLRFENPNHQLWVQYYINSISVESFVSGMAQPKLNQKKLNQIPIPVPSLFEQERIVGELDTLMDMRKNLEVKYQCELDNLEELRQSILEQAFEGKLTEPAAA